MIHLLKRAVVIGLLAAFFPCAFSQAAIPLRARSIVSFDPNWRFLKADAAGAQEPAYEDSSWRTLSVPHDWSIEGPFDQNNPASGAGAFLPAGTGWYRKHFTLPASDSTRRIFIDFDGVMANSDVWINGYHLGHRPYGYVSFEYDLTGRLHFGLGSSNVLAVRVDDSAQPASRWYAGAGINRHVRLIVADPVHFEQWSTFVTTPEVSAGHALVRVQSVVVNQSDSLRAVRVQTTIQTPDGHAIQTVETTQQTIAAGQSTSFQQEIPVSAPQLWNLDHPVLYSAVTRVHSGNNVIDDQVTPFGIRECHFEAATGFWLNGKNIKLKGVCLHQDAGGLGTAVPIGAWERRLSQLKQVGCNAIRTSHSPVAPEFLDLCDRMGFLVMDEMFDCWTVAKNPYDYHLYFKDWSLIDTRDTVRRDRNHPSVVLYSAGNEIHDTPNAPLAKQILASLITVFHENDPTRPVTQALFRPNVSHDYDNGLADMLDVIGTNYRYAELLAAHAAKPTRKIIGTENGHELNAWLAVRDNAPDAGEFLWTGIDYLGEARRWPTIGAGSGLFDRTGVPHPRAFERQSWWSVVPMVRIARRIAQTNATPTDPGFAPLRAPLQTFCDWSPKDSSPHTENVEVYSNCDQVEFFLNGRSLGSEPRPADGSARTWLVPFEPGIIRAVAKNEGKVVASDELRTAGAPAKILLSADRSNLAASWDDVSYVTATVTDANGVPIPDASDLIIFRLTGPGSIAAVDNGDLVSHEPFLASQRHAYLGWCVAILRAAGRSGRMTLTASAPGLAPASVGIEIVPSRR